MKDQQSGDNTLRTEIISLLLIILVMGVLLYFMMHVEQPYVWVVDYIYKSNYYKEFKLPTGYDEKTQGRNWSNWDVDEIGIQKICDLFNESAGYINKNPKTKSSKQCLMLWEEWIVAFLDELEHTNIVNPGFQGFPWGKNWYQFTISAPTNLAYYIVNKNSSGAIKTVAAKAIQYLIIDPEHSLGYTRDKANSAMMLFPWTLSHMITGTLDKTNPSFIYAVEQYNLAPSTKILANEDGVHLDYSYLTHNGVYAYGYLFSIYNIYPDTMQIIPEVAQFNLDYHIDKIYSKLKHRTIDTAGCALWHRYFKLDGNGFYTGKTVTKKCEVIPSMRYIRYFDDNIHFSARAMQTTVAYYEADQNVDNMGLYSALCRRIFHENDDPVPKFPDIGFIYPIGTTELISTPTQTSTTTPFYCMLNSKSQSFVWTDNKEFAILRSIEMKLIPLLPETFGEFFCIYLKDERIQINYQIPLNYAIFCGDQEWKREAGNELDQYKGLIQMDIDLKTRKYTSKIYKDRDRLIWFTEFTGGKYSSAISTTGVNSYIISRYSTIVSYIPSENEIILPTITNIYGTFELHEDNQYWLKGYDYVSETFN